MLSNRLSSYAAWPVRRRELLHQPWSVQAFSFGSGDNPLYTKPAGIGHKRWDQLKRKIKARRTRNQKSRSAGSDGGWDESVGDGLNKVQSIWDKLEDVTKGADGKVTHNYIMMESQQKDMPYRKYQFASMEDFTEWKAKNEARHFKKMRERLTPHQFHLTQLKHGMERAFTGEYWWTNDVGRYDCIVCTQRLFMYDHKYINKSGYPTFWNCLENAVKFVSDNLEVNKVTNAHECPTLKGKMPVKRCVCSNVSNQPAAVDFFLS